MSTDLSSSRDRPTRDRRTNRSVCPSPIGDRRTDRSGSQGRTGQRTDRWPTPHPEEQGIRNMNQTVSTATPTGVELLATATAQANAQLATILAYLKNPEVAR